MTQLISKQLIDAAQLWADADGELRTEEESLDNTEDQLIVLTEELQQAKQAFVELAESVDMEAEFKEWCEENDRLLKKLDEQYKLMKELDAKYQILCQGKVIGIIEDVNKLRKQLFGDENEAE